MSRTTCIRSASSGSNARLFGASGQNVGDAQQCQMLTVAFGALAGVFPATLHIVDQLFAFDLLDHFGLNRSTGNHWRTDGYGFAANHQNFVELDLIASNSRKLFYAQNVTRLHLVLLAASLEDRVHGSFLLLLRILWPPFLGVSGFPASDSAPLKGVMK
jgi:hypothetical protein